MLSAGFVLVFQGGIVCCRAFSPGAQRRGHRGLDGGGLSADLAIGLNILGITKIKAADYAPAIFLAPLCIGLHLAAGLEKRRKTSKMSLSESERGIHTASFFTHVSSSARWCFWGAL
jgi:hypothetical protein